MVTWLGARLTISPTAGKEKRRDAAIQRATARPTSAKGREGLDPDRREFVRVVTVLLAVERGYWDILKLMTRQPSQGTNRARRGRPFEAPVGHDASCFSGFDRRGGVPLGPVDDLEDLLRDAAAADGMSRIGFRDRIAAFGGGAIARLESWLADPRLAAFAVRTIERAAALPGAAAAARAALERADAPASARDDVEAALARLGGRTRPALPPLSRGGRSRAGLSAPAQAGDPMLLRQFDADMMEVYEAARREAGYVATRFLQKLRRDGGLETARYLLRQPGVSKGFIGLWKAAKLDLSMEYLVLRPRYASLFSDEERAVARDRLVAYGLTAVQLPR